MSHQAIYETIKYFKSKSLTASSTIQLGKSSDSEYHVQSSISFTEFWMGIAFMIVLITTRTLSLILHPAVIISTFQIITLMSTVA